MLKRDKYIDLPDLIKYLHSFGVSLRLTCVCCKDMMDTVDTVEEFINFAKANKVEQVTLRPVNDKFKEMDQITENCFNRIKKLIAMDNEYVNAILDFYPFGDDERYRGKYLLDNTQNAKNWIVGAINTEYLLY